ncbi:CPS-53 (KpLE1) prophage protein [Escherichia coli]|nr:hypothetical protein [Escherichia coli]STG94757.1 CPS-53 (KpLE1) prophage protein [Escherichia coli]HBK3056369.1 hypothetical protein [Escherichia coli]
MKQMSLIEMDDFLKGKCIPRDLKVNETNAEYLVRKFAEAEAKCAALAEDQQKAIESIKQADAAVKLAHEKFSALAAENAGLKHAMAVTLEHVSVTDAGQAGVAAMIINDALHHSETPTTDAFLAEVRAQGVEMAMEHMQSSGSLTFGDCYISLNEFAAQLRKGGNQ